MINEYICTMCGTKFTPKDYPNIVDAVIAMKEHMLTKCGMRIFNKIETKIK